MALASRSEKQVTAGLTAEDQAELRRLLGIVYDNVKVEPHGTRARIW